jgi:ADP-heptose:LPS heptosyltransferase
MLAARATAVPPQPGPLEAKRVERVLLVCTGLIGDTLMSLPAISAARGLFPAAELVGLVTPTTHALLSMAACVDRFIPADSSPLRLRPGRSRSAVRIEADVRAGRFDLAVVFLGDDYAPMLTRAGIPHRVFVADPHYGRLATATYEIGHPRTWGPRERLDAWRALGLEPGEVPVRLAPPPEATEALETRRGVPSGLAPLLVHPFGSQAHQWWPYPSVLEFIRIVEGRQGLPCLVVGAGPGTRRHLSTDPRFRLVDQLSLEELTALMMASAGVVSTDSGPYHLAGVLQRPGVGLFRAVRPEHARRYPSIMPIVAPDLDDCRGRCSWDRCCHTPCRQMGAIAPQVVADAVEARVRVPR